MDEVVVKLNWQWFTYFDSDLWLEFVSAQWIGHRGPADTWTCETPCQNVVVMSFSYQMCSLDPQGALKCRVFGVLSAGGLYENQGVIVRQKWEKNIQNPTLITVACSQQTHVFLKLCLWDTVNYEKRLH